MQKKNSRRLNEGTGGVENTIQEDTIKEGMIKEDAIKEDMIQKEDA